MVVVVFRFGFLWFDLTLIIPIGLKSSFDVLAFWVESSGSW